MLASIKKMTCLCMLLATGPLQAATYEELAAGGQRPPIPASPYAMPVHGQRAITPYPTWPGPGSRLVRPVMVRPGYAQPGSWTYFQSWRQISYWDDPGSWRYLDNPALIMPWSNPLSAWNSAAMWNWWRRRSPSRGYWIPAW